MIIKRFAVIKVAITFNIEYNPAFLIGEYTEQVILKSIILTSLLLALLVSPTVKARDNTESELESESKSKTDSEIESNSDSSTSLWGQITKITKDATETVSQKASNISLDAKENYHEIAAYSNETFNDFMLRVDENVATMEKLGYVVTDLYIGVDLIPSVSMRVTRVSEVLPEQQKKILEQSENNGVLKYIMSKLDKAYSIEVGNYAIKAVKFDLSIPPRTSVHMIKSGQEKHSQSFIE